MDNRKGRANRERSGERAAEPLELAGLYFSEGPNPDGSTYRGLVQIMPDGETFLVSWMFLHESDEGMVVVPTWAGIGVVHGEMLAVSYFGRQKAGVILYRIEEGGRRLAGRWTAVGDGGHVHAEILIRVPKPSTESQDTDGSPDEPASKPAYPLTTGGKAS